MNRPTDALDPLERIAAQARRDLNAQARAIAETDDAWADLLSGGTIALTPSVTPQRSNRLALAAAVVGLAAATAVAVALAVRQDSADIVVVPATAEPSAIDSSTVATTVIATTVVESLPSATTVAAGPAAWETLDVGPLSPRWAPLVVATDDEIVVFGGRELALDGSEIRLPGAAAYNPESGRWRELPGGDLDDRFTAALWDGDRIVAVTPSSEGSTGSTSSIDPDSGERTESAAPPIGFEQTHTSDGMIALTRPSDPGSSDLATLTPGGSGELGWVVHQPVAIDDPVGVHRVAGRVVVVGWVNSDDGGAPVARAFREADDGTWEDLALPLEPLGGGVEIPPGPWTDGSNVPFTWGFTSVAVRDQLFLWGHSGPAAEADGTAMVWSPTSGWESLPPHQQPTWECGAQAIPVPNGLLIDSCGQLALYDATARAVTALPDAQTWDGRGGALPIVRLGDALYRWGAEIPYAEPPAVPAEVRFVRLSLTGLG